MAPLFLQYHKITTRFELGGTRVTPVQLRRHCRDLREAGYEGFHPDELRDFIGGRSIEKKKVLFTFDDGYRCIRTEALPILSEFGFIGLVFIPAAYIGEENLWDASFGRRFRHLDAEEIRDLQSEGWIIGSHGLRHPDLKRLPDEQLSLELTGSKRTLEDLTGREVFAFSYPYGRFDGRVRSEVSRAGYRCAFRSGPGPSGDIFALGRHPIYCIDRHVRGKLADSGFRSRIEQLKERVIPAFSTLSPLVRYRLRFLSIWVGMRD
jgi:peptidoglycan/xylan/chitin deacetylase (PgdA/CDA1 family)